MAGRPTGGNTLSMALSGGGTSSYTGYQGPSSKYLEAGGTVEGFAAKLPGRDKKNLFEGRLEPAYRDDDLTDRTRPPRGRPNAHTVKVSSLIREMLSKEAGPRFMLSSFLPGLEDTSSVAGEKAFGEQAERMLPDHDEAIRAGVLKHPEYFLHGGFDQVSGTAAGSVQEAAKSHDGEVMPDEDYGHYQREKDLRALKAKATSRKVACLIVKLGLASPPMTPASGFAGVPNGPEEVDLDTARVTGYRQRQPTETNKVTRHGNLASKTATVSAAAASPSSLSSAPSANSISSSESKSTSKSSGADLKPVGAKSSKNPRRSYADALKLRPYTEGVQTAYQMLGPPGLDARFPNTKLSSLLRRFGFR